jgi:hypothetical protein
MGIGSKTLDCFVTLATCQRFIPRNDDELNDAFHSVMLVSLVATKNQSKSKPSSRAKGWLERLGVAIQKLQSGKISFPAKLDSG